MSEKPWQDSLWMDCLFELYDKAQKEGRETVEFTDVDALTIEKSKVPYQIIGQTTNYDFNMTPEYIERGR